VKLHGEPRSELRGQTQKIGSVKRASQGCAQRLLCVELVLACLAPVKVLDHFPDHPEGQMSGNQRIREVSHVSAFHVSAFPEGFAAGGPALSRPSACA
jgi:hypothetical protein